MNYSMSIFTMPNCPSCVSLKKWLNQENINFIEKDIINDKEAKKEFLEQELKYTPHTFIEIDGQKHEIIGFNKNKITKLINNER